MSKLQNWVLILVAVVLGWGIIRFEAFMQRVDRVTATAERAMDNLARAESVMRQSQATLEKASQVGHSLLERAGQLRMEVRSRKDERATDK